MRILRNYILRDFFSGFFFSLLFLIMIMLLVFLMMSSHMVLRKGVDLTEALKICSFYIIYLVGLTLPFAFLLGVLLSIGRLVADNEVIAINVAGVSLHRIMSIFLLLGIIFSLLLFYLNNTLIPELHYRYRAQRKNILFKNIATLIEPGIFLEHFSSYILYVSDKQGNKLKNIFIYEVDEATDANKITFAKRGEFVADGNVLKMKLEEGWRDETDPKKGKDLYRLNFKIFFMDIPIEKKEAKKVDKKASDMKLKELQQKIQHLRKKGVEPIELLAEFHERISFPFSIIPFVILGFGISLLVKHREKSINMGIAVLAGLGGYLLFLLGQTLVETRLIMPAIGMWLPNVIILLIGVILLSRNAYFR